MRDRVAFLFPGQGRLPAQLPPLSPDLEALYADTETRGLELRGWIRSGDLERLTPTAAAQPAVFLDSLAKLASLRERGLEPDVVAGHSLGEYSALVAAQVLPARTALDLVCRRGRLMAGVQGGMSALLKLDHEVVARLCAAADGRVVIANHNGPGQLVVSGPLDALAHVERLAADSGGRAVRLALSGPFHSPLMQPAEAGLAPFLKQASYEPPRAVFVSSVSGRPERDPAALQALLMTQITAPVRWADVLHSLADLGVTQAIEVGVGSVLTQLGKRSGVRVSFHAFEEVGDAGV
jgi:[acyl-carrier-protein] S-malonyltransferase